MIAEELPNLPEDLGEVQTWVAKNLAGLFSGEPVRSRAFVGGQVAANQALAALDIDGYAGRRSQVDPPADRGATKLSPYIRHGLLPLPQVERVSRSTGSSYDQFRYGGELLWQEYSRHWYAVEGAATRAGVAREPVTPATPWTHDPWRNQMACMSATIDELHTDGWVVNQARMWLATQWTVRGGREWRDGEDHMFRHLLDGSRAANRQGWQWVVGGTRSRAYGLARRQVLKRSPRFCEECPIEDDCPIKSYAKYELGNPAERSNYGPTADEFGPSVAPADTPVDAVWLTAESLGDDDPALVAHPEAPVIFVFDRTLLERLQLDGKRLVFLTECLADLSNRRDVTSFIGDPVAVAARQRVAVTFAPVPGFKRRLADLAAASGQLHPWPYLRPPTPQLLDRLEDSSTFPSFRDWCRLTKP